MLSSSVLPNDAESVSVNIDKLFRELSISEIHKYLASLKSQLYMRQEDQQGLVVSKYPSLLYASNKIDYCEQHVNDSLDHCLSILKEFNENLEECRRNVNSICTDIPSIGNDQFYWRSTCRMVDNVFVDDIFIFSFPSIILRKCIIDGKCLEACELLSFFKNRLDEVSKSDEKTFDELRRFASKFQLCEVIRFHVSLKIRNSINNNADQLNDALEALRILDGVTNDFELISIYLQLRTNVDNPKLDKPIKIVRYHLQTFHLIGSIKCFSNIKDMASLESKRWHESMVPKLKVAFDMCLSEIKDVNELENQINIVSEANKNNLFKLNDLLFQSVIFDESLNHGCGKQIDDHNDWFLWNNDNSYSMYPKHLTELYNFIREISKFSSITTALANKNDRLHRIEFVSDIILSVLNFIELSESSNHCKWRVLEILSSFDLLNDQINKLKLKCEKQWTNEYLNKEKLSFFSCDDNELNSLLTVLQSESSDVNESNETVDVVIPGHVSHSLLDFIVKFLIEFDRIYGGRVPNQETMQLVYTIYADKLNNDFLSVKDLSDKSQIWRIQLLFDLMFIEKCLSYNVETGTDTISLLNNLNASVSALLDPVDLILISEGLQNNVNFAYQSMGTFLGNHVGEQDPAHKIFIPFVDSATPLDMIPFSL
ncbi:hypothetical protein GJ496_000341 [Pomphorhynchus laevis]|nr:hypothetical protein GJ496_000341 [Pomphorhynchus laevis]